MNALTKIPPSGAASDELIRVLQNSLYPGAKADSVALVLAWCRSTGRDPMKKPVHIVPMSVKIAGTDRYEWRDVLMPGIGTYRTDAAETGEYVGKSEPEFGPETTREFDGQKVTFPLWCKVTVYRYTHGEARAFPAKEFWIENYALGKGNKGVNAMWSKRCYGQLAKVAESQALRMAFPDETGNSNTAEEMEGKSFAGMTIDAEPQPKPPQPAPAQLRQQTTAEYLGDAIPDAHEPAKRPFGEYLRDKLAASTTPHEVAALRLDPRIQPFLTSGPPDAVARAAALIEARIEALMPPVVEGARPPADEGPELSDSPPTRDEPPAVDDDLSGGM